MSTPITPEPSPVILERLSARFAEMSRQMSMASTEVAQLRLAVQQQTVQQQTVQQRTVEQQTEWSHAAQPSAQTPPPFTVPQMAPNPMAPNPMAPNPMAPNPMVPNPMVPNVMSQPQMLRQSGAPQAGMPPSRPMSERVAAASDRGLVGAILAVAGVGVTLVGIVFLLVLAAQAGILRPEFRVAGGAVLGAALVGAGLWWHRRPAGHVGAVAAAATGIAAGYLDVLAATRIYGWLPPIAGLAVAALVAGGGLVLARRWDSEHLGLLVVVPLIVLAPVLTGGVDVTVIGFMLVLSAATLWLQIGREWTWLFAVRTAAPTIPLVLAAVTADVGAGHAWHYIVAAALNAGLAVASAAILGSGASTRNTLSASHIRVSMTLISVAAVVPIAISGPVVGTVPSVALMLGASAVLLTLAAFGKWFLGSVRTEREIWLVTSLVLTLIAVITAFDASVVVALVLAMALVAVAAASAGGELGAVSRCSATVLGLLGVTMMLARVRPVDLAQARDIGVADGVATVIAAVLAVSVAVGVARLWAAVSPSDPGRRQFAWGAAGIVSAYAITVFTVTAATLLIGGESGFLAGHVLATICWMIIAAAIMIHARRVDRASRTPLLTGALCLVAASMAKLFLFDLATLDGIFRVLVFLVTGLILLAMGAWYARSLDTANSGPVSARNDCDATVPGR